MYEFLKRTSIVRYDQPGLTADADAIISLANAEGLDGPRCQRGNSQNQPGQAVTHPSTHRATHSVTHVATYSATHAATHAAVR